MDEKTNSEKVFEIRRWLRIESEPGNKGPKHRNGDEEDPIIAPWEIAMAIFPSIIPQLERLKPKSKFGPMKMRIHGEMFTIQVKRVD
jgi:hypothetical protein